MVFEEKREKNQRDDEGSKNKLVLTHVATQRDGIEC